MNSFTQINVVDAKKLMNERSAVLVDIRNADSFATSHAEYALNLTQDTISDFMNEVSFKHPILVMCYHGVSSQSVSQYFVNQGYEEVYSIDGGFSAWHMAGLPIEEN